MKIGARLCALALVALPLAGACVDDDFRDGQFTCDPSGGDDECPPGQSCAGDGLCRHSATPADACKKRTCDEAQPSCGTVDDGCGGLLECGCWPPATCGGGGIEGKCGCMPQQVIERSPRGFYVVSAKAGDVLWTDPENARASDGQFAQAELASGKQTSYLRAADFGFDLPDTAIVQGVEVVIERAASVADAITDLDVRVALFQLLPKNAKKSAAWATATSVATYGAPDDLWEAPKTITPADVNGTDFGVALAAIATADATASVDAIRLRVHFANPDCKTGDAGTSPAPDAGSSSDAGGGEGSP